MVLVVPCHTSKQTHMHTGVVNGVQGAAQAGLQASSFALCLLFPSLASFPLLIAGSVCVVGAAAALHCDGTSVADGGGGVPALA